MTHHDRAIRNRIETQNRASPAVQPSTTPIRFLSRDEEKAHLRAWREHEDQQALAALAHSHRPLVVKIATQLNQPGDVKDDLIQEGFIGLVEAANRFDLTRDVRFATYAKWWVRAAIKAYLLRNGAIVSFVRTAEDKALYYNLERLRRGMGERGPLSDEAKREIARILGVRISAVERMEMFLDRRDRSLQETPQDGSTQTLEDRLPDPSPSPEDTVAADDEAQFRGKCLRKALSELSERERTIVESRRLREDKVMLRDLGERFGISKERVRQIEKAAVEKIRAATLEHALSAGANPIWSGA